RLHRCDWPGNVRQLRNVVRQLVISSRGQPTLREDASVTAILDARAPTSPGAGTTAARAPAPGPVSPRPKVGEEELLAALAEHGWAAGPTAAALGIPRSTLYDLIDGSASIRKASDLGKDELELALASSAGDIDAMARALRVSKRGLQLRLRKLGLAGG
ncbi:MAG: sigma-54-dependent Fis family transcriptional regulator, partial [Deltaproteobacteria bacterium]|nr:sigma-54-dependent Fis family transcriptional regulator [Deltaproteobacteria bacterium]